MFQRHGRFATLAAATLAVGLIVGACGSNTTPSAAASGGAAPSDVPAASGDQPAVTPAEGKVTVNFWQQQFEDYQQAWFKQHVQEFNASQKKIKVNYLVVPADAWQQKLKAAQAAGNQPDVSTTN